MPMQPVVHSRSPNVASRSLLYQRWLVDRFPSDDEEDSAPRALGADTLHFQSLDLEPLRSDKRLLPVVFVDSRSYHVCQYENKPGLKNKQISKCDIRVTQLISLSMGKMRVKDLRIAEATHQLCVSYGAAIYHHGPVSLAAATLNETRWCLAMVCDKWVKRFS